MMTTSKKSKDIIGKVMHDFKHHELHSSNGDAVVNPKQAIAIALSIAEEADKSDESNKTNVSNKTKKIEKAPIKKNDKSKNIKFS